MKTVTSNIPLISALQIKALLQKKKKKKIFSTSVYTCSLSYVILEL